MSNRLFQGVVHQMRDAIDRVIGVIDENASIIACSELSKIGTTGDYYSVDFGESHDVFVRDGYTYKPFGPHIKADYAVFERIQPAKNSKIRQTSTLCNAIYGYNRFFDEGI